MSFCIRSIPRKPNATGRTVANENADVEGLHRQHTMPPSVRSLEQRAEHEQALLDRLHPAAPTAATMPWGAAADPCTQLANAHRLKHHFGSVLLYVNNVGWAVWEPPGPWKYNDLKARAIASRLGKLIAAEATGMASWVAEARTQDELKKRQASMVARFKFALQSEQRNAIDAALDLARPLFAVEADVMDANPWLLSCTNGVVDLRTGQLHDHRPEDRITKVAGTAFDPEAEPPELWLRFLQRTFSDDADLIQFAQTLAGYWATGCTDPHKLVICHGGGGNGKGVFFGALQAALGDYAMSAPHGMLIARRGEKPDGSAIAGLKGARLVVAAESGEGGALNEDLVKLLTGGDRLRARHLYRDYFEFTPSHKLILHTNHKPMIRGTDDGIRRRMWLVPFLAKISEAERDPMLAAKLATDLPGIMRWIVDGARRYADRGGRIDEPAVVAEASREYLAEQDIIGLFIDECCTVNPRGAVKRSALREAYDHWCDQAGENPMGDRLLGMRLAERGFKRERRDNGYWYTGLTLELSVASALSWSRAG